MFDIDPKAIEQEFCFEEGKRWWNCPANRLPSVTKDFDLPESVILKDETIREGAVVPGRKPLSDMDLVKVALAMDEAGMTEMEVGFTAAVDEHRELATLLKKEGVKMKQSAHTRGWAEDWKAEIDGVIQNGADIVNLVCIGAVETEKFAYPHVKCKEDFGELYAKQIEYIKSQGAYAAFITSTNNTRLDLITQFHKQIGEAGVDRVYFADSFGSAIPETVKFMVYGIRDIIGADTEVAVHVHNDFGLGTANAVAAVTAGAKVVDVSINGLGDRGGMPSLDHVAATLETLYDVRTGVSMEHLKPLSDMVAELWGFPVEPHRAVIGDNMYRHETDMHIAALLSGMWYAYNVIKPETVGAESSLEFGPNALAKGDTSAVGTLIKLLGYKADTTQFDQILDLIREDIKGSDEGWATQEQVAKRINQVLGA
ncbi:MAG: hypothetical protein MI863_24640 [Desulfobacterales bacterium]|nr:hypothetical protein [Desulfobacterales bacterium]